MKPSQEIYRMRIQALRQRITAATVEIAEIQSKCPHPEYEVVARCLTSHPEKVWWGCVACGKDKE